MWLNLLSLNIWSVSVLQMKNILQRLNPFSTDARYCKMMWRQLQPEVLSGVYSVYNKCKSMECDHWPVYEVDTRPSWKWLLSTEAEHALTSLSQNENKKIALLWPSQSQETSLSYRQKSSWCSPPGNWRSRLLKTSSATRYVRYG